MTACFRNAAAALALGLALAPIQLSAETLTDTLISAYRHSGLLERNRAVLRAADEDVAQAVAILRPQIGYIAEARASWREPDIPGTDPTDVTGSFGISADLLLYDFGRSELAVDAAKESVLIAREGLMEIEQQVLFDAVTAYTAVRRTAAFVRLRESNVRLISEQLRAARERFEVGEVTRTDVAIAEARLAAAQSGLTTAEGNLAQAIAVFVQNVGRRPGDLSEAPVPETAASLEAAQEVARRLNPAMRRAMRQVTLAELNVLRAEKAVNPTIRGTANVSVGDGFNESASVGIQMSGPIYQGGQLTALYRQARARRDEARANLHVVRHAIDQNVANAWARLRVARGTLRSSQEQIRAARVAFRGVQEEAKLGARTTLDVLDAEQELLDARATGISAKVGRAEAAYAVLAAMGLLTVDHLNLGIVTYDPSAYYKAVRDAPVRKVSPRGEKLDKLLESLGR